MNPSKQNAAKFAFEYFGLLRNLKEWGSSQAGDRKIVFCGFIVVWHYFGIMF